MRTSLHRFSATADDITYASNLWTNSKKGALTSTAASANLRHLMVKRPKNIGTKKKPHLKLENPHLPTEPPSTTGQGAQECCGEFALNFPGYSDTMTRSPKWTGELSVPRGKVATLAAETL
mmetsp:Transcript_9091/g.19856  ORF Transcript_9091/g.19856 Transcript_9091/m.19856 type:complete len:121 (-) Transcript_9091:675-1037(-)